MWTGWCSVELQGAGRSWISVRVLIGMRCHAQIECFTDTLTERHLQRCDEGREPLGRVQDLMDSNEGLLYPP